MEPFWIWQQADWPNFRWQDREILPRLRHVQRRLGILIGSHSRLGDPDQTLDTLLANIIASSAIEGELRCPDKIGQSRIKQPEQFSNTSC
ncbi:DUF4172 domain-containing protein [Aeromonas veronii]|uniref:DUF4172 domain-containing protein n=1 Tax=Aeromonas veronii TaxID=654 RepID=UPI0030070F15